MNIQQQKVLNKLSKQFAVDKRVSYQTCKIVNNKPVYSIEQSQENSYIVHIDKEHSFDIVFFNENEVCLVYFFKNDDDYSESVMSLDDFDDEEIAQLIKSITEE